METKQVLFLCPHAAAKSVFAMTYFNAFANEVGLDAIASNAGTEPDASINPKVNAYLQEEGFTLTGFTPQLLTAQHLEAVDIVVSIGCISSDHVPDGVRFIDWSDVPQLSDDFQASRSTIYEYVQALVAELELEQLTAHSS